MSYLGQSSSSVELARTPVRAGLKPERGAGSAVRGGAQRSRLDLVRRNSAVNRKSSGVSGLLIRLGAWLRFRVRVAA
jgi:hypothetical protein